MRCLVLGGWGVAEAGVRAGAVVPVDPGQGEALDVVDGSRRSGLKPGMIPDRFV
nr:hypothetical protein [Corynebacterium efficiens]